MTRPATTTDKTSAASVHLDALRGAAALLVFTNHTRALYFASPLAQNPRVDSTGRNVAAHQVQPSSPDVLAGEGGGNIRIASAAVIVFFVLSGYLVGGSVLRSLRMNQWSWKTYLSKRLVRLLIVLVPAVLIGACLDTLGSHLFGAGSIYTAPAGLHLMVSAELHERLRPLVLVGNLLFLQNILVPIEGTNVSLWSLANEFWYYLIFPLLACVFFSQFSRITKLLSVVAAAALCWFVGFRISILFPVWLMGALVSMLPLKMQPTVAKRSAWIALVALLASIAFVRMVDVDAVVAEYIIGVFTSLLLYTLIQQRWMWQSVPRLSRSPHSVYRRVSKFFSDISYSLYLFHLPLAVFLCAVADTPWHSLQRGPASLLWYSVSDCLILTLAYLLWMCFEARTDVVRKRLFGNPQPSAERGSPAAQPLSSSS